MACNNPKCNCNSCTNDACGCDGSKECVCKPEDATCCYNK